jgi:hypothetical protein
MRLVPLMVEGVEKSLSGLLAAIDWQIRAG